MKLVSVLFAFVATEVAAITPGWDGICESRKFREPAKSYWSSVIGDGAFDVAWYDGATGNVWVADDKLVIEKKNGRGYGVVSARDGFSQPKGKKLRSFVDAEVLGADGDYSLALPRILDARRRLHSCWMLDAVGIFMGGGQKMAYLVNTPPGVAERRFSHHIVSDGGENLVPSIVIAGSPAMMKVVRWGVEDYDRAADAWVKERGRFHPKRDHKGDLEDSQVFVEGIAADVEHTAKVKRGEDGKVRLMVDGREELPFIYKNPHSWNRNWGDYNGRAMSRNGVRLQTVNVGGDHHWKGAEWNREQALKDVRDQMRCSPDALYVMSFGATTPREYAEANPSEVTRHPDGTPIWGQWSKSTCYAYNAKKKEMPEDSWPWISMSSTKYLKDMKDILAGLVADLRREGLSKRIIGIHFCGWHDGQFAQYRPDFSECARRGFIRHLRSRGMKVGDDFKLPVPGLEMWYSGERAEIEHEFAVYQHLAPFRVQEELARTAKIAFGKDIVTMHWSMGVWGGQMNCSHYIEEMCRSDAMDAMVSQPSYVRRLPGSSVGVITPTDSFALHGKLYVDELDLRAYGLIAGYLKEPSIYGLGHASDFPTWQTINRRMVGRMYARGQGLWYYDISGGFYDPPEIAADIGEVAKEGRKLMNAPSPAKPCWKPSAALVVDEKGMLWRNSIGNAGCSDVKRLVDTQVELLSASGVPYSTWTAADAMEHPEMLEPAKVVVLGGFFRLDGERERLVRRLLDEGKTVVILYGFADDSWRRLGIVTKCRALGSKPEIVAADGSDSSDFISAYHCEWMRWSLGVNAGDIANNNRPASASFEEGYDGAVTLARYEQDNQPAVVRKGNMVVFGQSAALTPQYFNRLVREAGGYAPVEGGLEVDLGEGFLSVHALRTGKFRFKLPFACKPVNLRNGAVENVDNDGALPLDMVAGETCWFELKRD